MLEKDISNFERSDKFGLAKPLIRGGWASQVMYTPNDGLTKIGLSPALVLSSAQNVLRDWRRTAADLKLRTMIYTHCCGSQAAVAYSDKSMRVIDTDTCEQVSKFKAHTQTITGQAAVSPNCWATSSEDGTVKLWDARTKNLVSQAGLKSPVYSIAIGAGGQILAAGVDSDLQFFDIRNIREVLGCYTESHSERINQLVFHPDLPTQLMSASEDGLVCVFDIVVAGEDDAVASVMNTESAVNKVGFFGPSSAFAYALTQSETLSLWNVGSAERIGNFRDVIQNLEGTAYSVQYLVDCMYEADSQRLTLVCGDHHGSILFMDVSPTDLSFAGDVPGHTGGHKSTVRNVKSTTDGGLISTGDDGYVHRWDRVSAEDAAVAMKAHAESAGQASTAAAGGLSADGSAVGGGGGGGGAVGREPVGRGAFLGGSISQSMVLHGVRRKVRHQKHRRPHS